MPRLLRDPLHRTCLLLLLATVSAFELRVHGLAGLTVGAATLAFAYAKGRLIVLEFMELRQAGSPWRGIVEGWVLAISLLIFAIYWFGGPRARIDLNQDKTTSVLQRGFGNQHPQKALVAEVGVVYALSAAAPCSNWSRSSRFITFPLAVNGSDGTNSTCLGTLYPAMRVRQCATTWSFDNVAEGSCNMAATTRSPHFSSGSPTTAHSCTPLSL